MTLQGVCEIYPSISNPIIQHLRTMRKKTQSYGAVQVWEPVELSQSGLEPIDLRNSLNPRSAQPLNYIRL